jgi:superfamily II DNA or RNA helicase/HKD family nuclease
MASTPAKNDSQTFLDFNQVRWPDQELFPLNFKGLGRTVQKVVYQDIEESEEFLIVTGFTSLSNLIDLFGSRDFEKVKKVRVLIGFEPNIKGRKKYQRLGLDKEIKDYWLKKGLSIMQGGAVIHLIEKIKSGLIEFRFRDKLHAKIYIGDSYAVLGSSNFSYNGLNIQEEANIRVKKTNSSVKEQEQYFSIKKIAESYYEDSANYNDKIIELLQTLIGETSWQEALARAIAEMLEGGWLREYKDIITKLEQTKLWPTQWKGLAQAVSILQSQSNVLIADPTGAGKTKLCTAVVLSLQHWLYEIGKNYRTESLIICPPLVLEKWSAEFKAFNRINHSQISTGLLSNSSGKNKKKISEELSLANILVIDEAHNYLSAGSKRTMLLKDNKSDYKILITATPISKKVEDLLRLIDLLDVDNLTDKDFDIYQQLVLKPYLGNRTENINNLRKFISKFTVRRTKKGLNKEIDKERESYVNRLGNICRFPQQYEKTYITQESDDDKILVQEINALAQQIKGVTYLTTFHPPKYEIHKDESLQAFVTKRIHAGKALSIYMIRSALRSSHVALVEHIIGSIQTMKLFDFTGKNNGSGDKLKRLEEIIAANKIPYRSPKFKKEFFPDWLTDERLYFETCRQEIELYTKMAEIAQKLSGKRELGKVQELIRLAEEHKNILAFDSTVITLYYFKKVFETTFPRQKLLVATGSEDDKGSQRVLDIFKLDSTNEEKHIALCSDKMSESVDLQKASCVFLLDTPSVLRIVEQRIGRADRMDSMHDSIDIYWAVDSDEYSMKTDERLIETNDIVEQIYGANFEVPEVLKGRRFQQTESTEKIINEYKEFVDKDESWSGIHDSFQFIVNLKEGAHPLIEESLYQQFTDVHSEVKTRVSFISGLQNWCFIALRGDKNKSPRWYLIDETDEIHMDYPDVCQHLRANITKESIKLKWDDHALRKYVNLFKAKERELLPPKKRRALEVAQHILERKSKTKNISKEDKEAYEYMLLLMQPNAQEVLDFERLAEEWIIILQPYLKAKRENNRRKKVVLNLSSLKSDYKTIALNFQELLNIADQCIIADEIDKRIAACIIGIGFGNTEESVI